MMTVIVIIAEVLAVAGATMLVLNAPRYGVRKDRGPRAPAEVLRV